MATRNIVPRNTDEGGIGTSVKTWLWGFFNTLVARVYSDGTNEFTAKQVVDFIGSKDQASGLAALDINGKLKQTQIPDSLLGSVSYQGVWNAETNTPQIPEAAAENRGHYYKVVVRGSYSIDGVTAWEVGDWVISNGTSWDKVDNTDLVSSVNGKTGAIVLSKSDFDLENVTNNAQVIKSTNSTDSTVVLWDGDTGDKIKTGPPVGVVPNGLLKLDEDSKIPAVDGSKIYNINPLEVQVFI